MIPNKISQTFLDRQARPDEAVAVVVRANGSGLGTFTVQGRSNKTFAFQFNKKAGGHVLRFPASLWAETKNSLALELFDRNLPVALIPTVEPWDASRPLSDLILAPLAEAPAEEPLVDPESDQAPGPNGLAVIIPATEEDLAEARGQGGEDFAAGLLPKDNPFDYTVFPELSRAWQDGFEAAEQEAAAAREEEPPAVDAEAPTEVVETDDEPTAGEAQDPVEEDAASETQSEAPAEEPVATPSPFEFRGSDIYRTGTEEKVGGLYDPNDHLRMARGKTDEREEVEAWLATNPEKPSAPVTE